MTNRQQPTTDALPVVTAGQDASTVSGDLVMSDWILRCARCGDERVIAAQARRPQANFGSQMYCRRYEHPTFIYVSTS